MRLEIHSSINLKRKGSIFFYDLKEEKGTSLHCKPPHSPRLLNRLKQVDPKNNKCLIC